MTMRKPPPCYQDWDATAKVPSGRLCAQCDKTIVDFSKKTWVDILEIQKASQFSTCGKYSDKQIKHWGHQPPAVDLSWFRKLSLTGMLVLVGLKSVDAQVVEKSIATEMLIHDSVLSPKDSTGFTEFKGILLDSITNKPLSYATLILPQKNGGVYTNEDGSFKLLVPNDLILGNKVQVTFKCMGYQDKKLILVKESVYTLSLKASIVPEGLVFRVSEPTLKQKTGKPFRRMRYWLNNRE